MMVMMMIASITKRIWFYFSVTKQRRTIKIEIKVDEKCHTVCDFVIGLGHIIWDAELLEITFYAFGKIQVNL